MSQDEQDAVIGRMVREQKELKKRHAELHGELYRIGEGLQRVGRDLMGMSSRASDGMVLSDVNRELLDAAKVENLINELRTANTRLDQIREALSKL